MMRLIIGEGLHDTSYIAAHTTGFEELRQRAEDYTPERVAELTGLAAGDIVQLAREYATTSPSLIRLNYGIQRVENGGMAVRAVAMLPIVTGAWRMTGGGLTLSTSGAFPLNKPALRRDDLMHVALGREARTLNMNQLGRLLTDSELAPPVKALFVYACNPAAVCPNHNLVVEGLKRRDLFTVVHEQFLTDTTDYADIVLPATTFLEHKDLVTAYGHTHLQLSGQAIAPLGEACSNAELFRRLAARMGIDEPALRATDDEMIDDALRGDHPFLAGITREALELEHSMALRLPRQEGAFLPFADGFATPSGKAELASRALAAQGLDPVAAYVAPQESRFSLLATRYPLELLSRKHDNFLNSSFCNLPGHQKMERRFELQMNHADAAPRGIREDDELRVFNQRGELRLRARLDDSVPAGVVAAYLDWARHSPGGRNINALTSDRLTDIGAGATFYSALVEVEKARATADLPRLDSAAGGQELL
jgi:anaerobic selenocysteine-containing dehydrogenase